MPAAQGDQDDDPSSDPLGHAADMGVFGQVEDPGEAGGNDREEARGVAGLGQEQVWHGLGQA